MHKLFGVSSGDMANLFDVVLMTLPNERPAVPGECAL